MPTLNLGLPYIAAAQAQKHVTHNDALDMADALVHLSVLSRVVSAPPATIADGSRYLVPASPTGAFAGQQGNLAIYLSQSWRFVSPRLGWRIYIGDERLLVVFDGTNWSTVQGTTIGPATRLETMLGYGIGTTFDTVNPLSAKLNGALFTARSTTESGTGDLRITLNKSAVGNTVSQLYQTNFSGRAETGLTGDDRFRIKVSPDGTSWKEAINIDPSTAQIAMPFGMINNWSGFRNRIINGNFDIWQRGTTFTVANNTSQYVSDRWLVYNGSSGVTMSFSRISAPAGFRGQYALNAVGTGCSIGATVNLSQRFEAQTVFDCDNQACTVSFDLNASTSAGALTGTFYLISNTAADNGTYSNFIGVSSFSVPVGAARVNIPLTAAQTAGLKFGAALQISITQTVSIGNISVSFGAVQFEKGSIANPFEFRSAGTELSLCQRYFSAGAVASQMPIAGASIQSFSLPQTMRATPSLASRATDAGAGYTFNQMTMQSTRDGFVQFIFGSGGGYVVNYSFNANAEL